MKDSFVLKFLDRFSAFFSSLGVDYPMMRRILNLKLEMDGRRVPTVMNGGRKSNGKSSYKVSLIIYLIMGVFIATFMFIPYPLYIKMNVTLGIILFMIMTTMISDFSAVLLDVRDKSILLTRPVDSRTLNAVKIVHIIIYLSGITAAIAGIPLIAGTINYGAVFFITFFVELILVCGFTILFTAILYFLILHFFSGEKLKDIINYFQIVLSIFMIVVYQLIGRLYSVMDFKVTVKPQWWNFALPSAWFSAPFTLFIEHDFNIIYILLSITSVVIPAAAMIIYVKAAAPAFERNLQKLGNSGDGVKRAVKKNSLQRTISRLFCRSGEEKAFFDFTTLMLKNERKLKLKMYPSLALAYIFPLIFMFSFGGASSSFANAYSTISHGKYYLFLYFSSSMFPMLCMMLGMSENYKGAWIYRALPILSPAPILRGSVKSFIFRFIVPFFILWGIILSVVYGLAVIPDVMLIMLNSLIVLMLVYMSSKKELPFYRDFDFTQGGKNTGIMMLLLLVCGILAAVHFAITKFIAPAVLICIPIALLAFLLIWHFSFKTSWNDLEADA